MNYNLNLLIFYFKYTKNNFKKIKKICFTVLKSFNRNNKYVLKQNQKIFLNFQKKPKKKFF